MEEFLEYLGDGREHHSGTCKNAPHLMNKGIFEDERHSFAEEISELTNQFQNAHIGWALLLLLPFTGSVILFTRSREEVHICIPDEFSPFCQPSYIPRRRCVLMRRVAAMRNNSGFHLPDASVVDVSQMCSPSAVQKQQVCNGA
eukprot:gnl/TRDRNA2_/TRDRNA2_205045_c0_seq1.p1 gnl/TRDRNA2_/TRDRNA2_205045_c0~~gnl/TRDRNA2_/TRDRNA2_205045_c0_seq1.p1  ORF type:complete len:144 (+),score=5.07 gnl/TRDRNA2_/TRDRNA2_205045_c0_seq1:213-644(+)